MQVDLEKMLDELDDETRSELVESIERAEAGYIRFRTPEPEDLDLTDDELDELIDNQLKSRGEMNYSNPADSFVAFIDDYVCPKCFCYLLLVPKLKKSDLYHSKCIACGWCNVKEEKR